MTALKQQGITQLRPNDLINMTQTNGRKMVMPVFVLIEYIRDGLNDMGSNLTGTMAANLAPYMLTATYNTLIAAYVTTANLTTTLANYATTAALSAYVTTASLASTLASYVTSSSLATTLAGYVTTTALNTALANKVELRVGPANGVVVNGRILATSITLSTAGTGSITLTDALGAALFPNGILSVQPVVNDATTFWPVSRAYNATTKVLTITANKSGTPLLALLGLNILAAPTAAPIGTTVELLIIGY